MTGVVVIGDKNTVVVDSQDQKTTVITGAGLLGPQGPAGKAGVALYSYRFQQSLEWLVVHNKNTVSFVYFLFDDSGSQFYAKVNILNRNSFIVKLTEATAGFVTIAVGN
jgi:hypothetical protein